MKKWVVLALLSGATAVSFAQTEITADGNWNNAGIWLSGNIGNTVSENVFIRNNVDVTITSPDSFTCGNITTGNNPSISINSGATLSVGSPGNPRSLSSNNGMTVTVAGDLVIYGDLNVDNNLIISITGVGTVTIIGNVTMNNNASITVNGAMNVGGNFVGGNNTNVNVNGSISVTGSTTVGSGSTLTGSGSFSTGGPCTGPVAFCSNPILPVSLIYFKADSYDRKSIVRWATASEENSDYFSIERATEDLHFQEIGRVMAQANSNRFTLYRFEDNEAAAERRYYRLKMVDRDGSFEYSNVVAVEGSGEFRPYVYPNPVRSGEILHIQNAAESGSIVSVAITDMMGRSVFRTETSDRDLKIPTAWAPGVYILSIVSGAEKTVCRVVVP